MRFDNYLIGFSQKGKGHARHNFIFRDGTTSGLKSKHQNMWDVVIPENVTIRRIIMYHMNDGTYLQGFQFFDELDNLILTSGNVIGDCKEIELRPNERIVGVKSQLAP